MIVLAPTALPAEEDAGWAPGNAWDTRKSLFSSKVSAALAFFAMLSNAPPPMATGKSRLVDLVPRFLSALVLMAVALFSLWQGGTIFVIAWLAASLAVFWEWQILIDGMRPLLRFLLGGAALAISAFLLDHGEAALACVVPFFAFFPIALAAGSGRRIWAGAGLLYAGALLVSVCVLRASAPLGTLAIVWLFATVWGTDVFAYFGGRLIGGPKLWRRISPSKTWSGTLTGVLCGAILGTAIVGGAFRAGAEWALPASLFPSDKWVAIWPVFLLGLVTAMVSQGGDIFESWIKRRFGVKDSSHLIPGHGGFMDRLDGFTAGTVFAALVGLLHWLAADGIVSLGAGLFFWF